MSQINQAKMEKEIELAGRKISYILKISRRAKQLRLAVYSRGKLVVTRPYFIRARAVDDFLEEKANWIVSKIDNCRQTPVDPLDALTRRDYLASREVARAFVADRLTHFNSMYGFVYKRISIRDQKTRWGSCSRSGNLNFNFKLLFLPERMRDYIIVHELCHLKEFNHSSEFWKLVARAIPDFRDCRAKLRRSRLS